MVRAQDRTIYEDSVFARMLRNAGLMVGVHATWGEGKGDLKSLRERRAMHLLDDVPGLQPNRNLPPARS